VKADSSRITAISVVVIIAPHQIGPPQAVPLGERIGVIAHQQSLGFGECFGIVQRIAPPPLPPFQMRFGIDLVEIELAVQRRRLGQRLRIVRPADAFVVVRVRAAEKIEIRAIQYFR
jgi:hypothetical protein